MNKPLIDIDDGSTMNAPSAPPAYDDEFKPPPCNPPPYNPQMLESQVQTASAAPPCQEQVITQAPYPQQLYAQPPQMYPAVMPQPQTQVITQTERVFVGSLPVGPNPLTTTCPNCQASVKTRTKTTTHGSAHLICILCCLFLCWCCSCLPYCMNSFHTVHHYCPNCKAFLGSYMKH